MKSTSKSRSNNRTACESFTCLKKEKLKVSMRVSGAAAAAVIVGLVLTACRGGAGDLQRIEQKRVDEHVVTLLNDTGQLKQGQSKLVLEFRRISDMQLADVGDVQVSLSMPAMPTMTGAASATPSGTPGRYDVTGDFSMRGLWNFMVTFGQSQHVPFALTVP